MVPANKATNNIVVVWPLYYIQTLKSGLSGTRAYKETFAEGNSVADDHCSYLPLKLSVNVKDRKDKLPTVYLLPKLHKKQQKHIKHDLLPAHTVLSKKLTSYLTVVKTNVIKYYKKVYERSGKISFGLVKSSGEVINKLREFRATC